MRLINADAIVYTHEVARCLDDGHNWNELCVTKDEIEDMPSIDAIEVVRCRDCKNRFKVQCPFNFSSAMSSSDMDFCSMGEETDG